MYEIKEKQTKIITGNNAEDFEMKLNKALAKLGEEGCSHEIQFNMNMGFCAYIVYTSSKSVAENKEEEYMLVGETHHCGECKYLPTPSDKRIKNVYCERVAGRLRSVSSPCCEDFYESLSQAENFLKGILNED